MTESKHVSPDIDDDNDVKGTNNVEPDSLANNSLKGFIEGEYAYTPDKNNGRKSFERDLEPSMNMSSRGTGVGLKGVANRVQLMNRIFRSGGKARKNQIKVQSLTQDSQANQQVEWRKFVQEQVVKKNKIVKQELQKHLSQTEDVEQDRFPNQFNLALAAQMTDSELRKYQRMLEFPKLNLELDARAGSKAAT